MTKLFIKMLLLSILLTFFISCKKPQSTKTLTPTELHKACTRMLKKNGGDPMNIGKHMCDSMKDTCERDPASKDCLKAQRIVKNG